MGDPDQEEDLFADLYDADENTRRPPPPAAAAQSETAAAAAAAPAPVASYTQPAQPLPQPLNAISSSTSQQYGGATTTTDPNAGAYGTSTPITSTAATTTSATTDAYGQNGYGGARRQEQTSHIATVGGGVDQPSQGTGIKEDG
ncbi:hypothetical protein KEM52_005448 [Ascosphaera acerosa]|nr:hypothetical protein KEM52_005448 [Ascosphaera acerosa]